MRRARESNRGLATKIQVALCLTFLHLASRSFFLRRMVYSGRFWKRGLTSARGNKSGLDEDTVNLYRYPSVGEGWEVGLLNFCKAQWGGGGKYEGSRGRAGDGELLLDACLECDEVVILHGVKDRIVPIRNSLRLKEFVEREGGRIRVRGLEGVGHVAHEERRGEFVKMVKEIVEEEETAAEP